MIFKSINRNNYGEENTKVINMIQNGDHVYILVHKLGCPPCMATRPEWLNIQKKIGNKQKGKNNIAVVDIENDLINGLEPYIGDIDGYPTMKLIKENGKVNIPYEKANISKKDRSVGSFIEWIEKDTPTNNSKKRMEDISISSPDILLERLQTKGIFQSKIKDKKKNRNRNRHTTKKRRKNKNKSKTKKRSFRKINTKKRTH